jgi:hypothetical protein
MKALFPISISYGGLSNVALDADVLRILHERSGEFGNPTASKSYPDIGSAKFAGGETLTITWGLNATLDQMRSIPDRQFVRIPTSCDASYEMVI